MLSQSTFLSSSAHSPSSHCRPRHISLNTSCPWPPGSGSWLSLSLEYSYLHSLPVEIKFTFKAQLKFHFPTTIHFNLIKSLCLFFHLFELLHSPQYQPCFDGEGDEDENVMQTELYGLLGSMLDSLRIVSQMNVFVPELSPWSVEYFLLADSQWQSHIN